MRVTRPARVILAEAMVFAATTPAAASAVLPVTDTGAAMCGATGAPTMDPWFRRFELEQSQERTATRTAGTKSSARHRSVQPLIIGRKAPKFCEIALAKSWDFRPRKGTQFGRGPVSVGRCCCFPQDFYKRFSGMIKQKLHLLFCKQRRRKHETHDNSISLCVRALQYVRACKNGSS